jgi:predicted component of type VI protein secretion system
MQIRINTDNHIQGSAELTHHIEQVVTDTLERFEPQITTVAVQLSDVNGAKNARVMTNAVSWKLGRLGSSRS